VLLCASCDHSGRSARPKACARVDSGLDKAKISSDRRVDANLPRLRASFWRTKNLFTQSGSCVDGSGLARTSSRLQHWSVQPCVRPFDAVHMTAGHNALRGSGPDQTPAFDNASTQVGCPDRRIDRLCITCCSPSQPSHHAGCPARSRLRRKRDGFLVSLALDHHGPDHSRELVGKRNSSNLGRPAAPARP